MIRPATCIGPTQRADQHGVARRRVPTRSEGRAGARTAPSRGTLASASAVASQANAPPCAGAIGGAPSVAADSGARGRRSCAARRRGAAAGRRATCSAAYSANASRQPPASSSHCDSGQNTVLAKPPNSVSAVTQRRYDVAGELVQRRERRVVQRGAHRHARQHASRRGATTAPAPSASVAVASAPSTDPAASTRRPPRASIARPPPATASPDTASPAVKLPKSQTLADAELRTHRRRRARRWCRTACPRRRSARCRARSPPAAATPQPPRPRRASRRISRAALCPGTPVTPPPGCAPEPHR